MAELVVAIDQGTTGTTVLVIDPRWHHPRTGLRRNSPVLSRVPDGSSMTRRRFTDPHRTCRERKSAASGAGPGGGRRRHRHDQPA